MFDINALEGQRRALTLAHIEDGIRLDCRHCAVALVLSEMVNDEVTVDVDGSSYTRLYDKQARQRCVGKLLISGDLEAWTEKYDRGKSVPTGELFIFRQEDEDDGDCLWVGIDIQTQHIVT